MADTTSQRIVEAILTANADAAIAAFNAEADAAEEAAARIAAASDTATEGLAGAGAAEGAAGLEDAGVAAEDTTAGLEDVGAAAADASVAVDDVGSKAAETGAKLEDAGLSAENAATSVAVVGAAADDAGAKLEDVGAKAEGASSDIEDAAGDAGAAWSTFGSNAQDTGEKVGSSLDSATTKSSVLGNVMNKSGEFAALGLVAISAASVKMAMDFQQSMTQLVTGAGESQKNIGMVSEGILDMAGQVGQTTSALASGMYLIESAGFHGAAGLEVLKASAEGAAVGGAQMATVANAVTTALTDYHLKVSDATQVTSALVESVASGKTTMDALASSIGKVMPTASALGVSFADVTGAMATMTNAGLTSRLAATTLNNALLAMAAPSATAVTALESVGLTAQQVKNAMSSEGLPAALALIEQHVGETFPKDSVASVEALKNIMGGVTGYKAALMLTGGSMDEFESDVKNIGDALDGGSKQVQGFTKVQGDLKFELDASKDGLEALAVKFGDVLIPVLHEGIVVIEEVVDWFEKHKIAAEALGVVIGSYLVVSMGMWVAGMLSGVAATAAAIAPTTAFGAAAGNLAISLSALSGKGTQLASSAGAVATSTDAAAESASAATAATDALAEGWSAVLAAQEELLAGSRALGAELGALSGDLDATAASAEAAGASTAAAGSEMAGAGEMAGAEGLAGGLEDAGGAMSGMLGPIGLAAGAVGGLVLGFKALFSSGPSAAQETAEAVAKLNQSLAQMPTSTPLQMANDLLNISTEIQKLQQSMSSMSTSSNAFAVASGKVEDLDAASISLSRQMDTMEGNSKALAAAFGITATQAQDFAQQVGINLKQSLDPAQVKIFGEAVEQSGQSYDTAATASQDWATTIAQSARDAVDAAKAGDSELEADTAEHNALMTVLMGTGGAQALAAFVNAQKGGLEQVKGVAEEYGVTIPSTYLALMSASMTSGGHVSMSKLTQAIEDGSGAFGDQMQSVVDDAISVLERDGNDKAGLAGSGLMQALEDAVSGKDTDVSSKADKVIRDAVALMDSHQGDAKTVGEALAEGVAQGLLSESGAAEAAATQLVENALAAAKAAAKVSSPSLRFAEELGVPIGQGVALGVSSTVGLMTSALASLTDPALLTRHLTAGALAGGSSLPVSPSAAAKGVGGGVVVNQTNTINVNGTNASLAQVQQIVVDALTQHGESLAQTLNAMGVMP